MGMRRDDAPPRWKRKEFTRREDAKVINMFIKSDERGRDRWCSKESLRLKER